MHGSGHVDGVQMVTQVTHNPEHGAPAVHAREQPVHDKAVEARVVHVDGQQQALAIQQVAVEALLGPACTTQSRTSFVGVFLFHNMNTILK